MTLQSKTANESSIATLFADNSTAGISESDERTIAGNLLDGIWGMVSVSIDNTDSPYTVDIDAVQIVYADPTSGAITINLPAVASNTNRYLTVKNIGTTNAVTVDGNASETIDGNTTYAMSTQYEVATFHCDGSQWWIINW